MRKLRLFVLWASATAVVLSACGMDAVRTAEPAPVSKASVMPEQTVPGAAETTPSVSESDAGLMLRLHVAHTASLLPDGRVLVAGGWDGYGAEIYDPGNRTWSVTSLMAETRDGHTATVLSDGTVLVIGGADTDMRPGHASAEIYDPAADTWTPTASMSTPRVHHAATLLPDGRVLVTGGSTHLTGGQPLASVEVYDPTRDQWTSVAGMQDARMRQTATMLQTGSVLVAGGSAASRASELFDPSQGTWSETGETSRSVQDQAAALLADGRVLIAGGAVMLSRSSFTANALAEVYNPTTGSWAAAGSSSGWRGAMTSLPGGDVLFSDVGSVTVYDPAEETWTAAPSLSQRWGMYSATTLLDGTVLMAGGWNGRDRLASPYERYTPPE